MHSSIEKTAHRVKRSRPQREEREDLKARRFTRREILNLKRGGAHASR